MRPYKKLTFLCGILAVISLGICLWLHYTTKYAEADFWINACLAVFGNAFLSIISSLISCFHEKRKALEGFMYHCLRLLREINKYRNSMSLEEKMEFHLNYHDSDKSAWDAELRNVYFFFERHHKNRAYIYNNIYHPLLSFNLAVDNCVRHFRLYFDGRGNNKSVMKMLVAQLEGVLLCRREQEIPLKYDNNGAPIAFCEVTSLESKLTRDISRKLSGKYNEIMYGKARYSKTT